MTMDDKDTLMRWVHESEVARLERVIKRLWILCIIIFVAFVLSNAMWIRYESQYEDVITTEKTITQDATSSDGGDAIINAVIDGTIEDGESKTDGNSQNN